MQSSVSQPADAKPRVTASGSYTKSPAVARTRLLQKNPVAIVLVTELRSCVKVEVDVLVSNSPYMVSVDVKQH